MKNLTDTELDVIKNKAIWLSQGERITLTQPFPDHFYLYYRDEGRIEEWKRGPYGWRVQGIRAS